MASTVDTDKISRATWQVCQSIKDVTTANVVAASRDKIKLKEPELSALVKLISASIEEGYHKSIPSFNKSVETIVTQSTQPATKKN